MDKRSSTVCVLIVALCALVHFGTVFSLVRPDILIGECPWHLNLTLTRMGCEDCPRDHTCCVYDGEEVCLPSVSPKPGVCPRMRLDVGPCVESCSYDSDCPNNEKCCSKGCGHQCMAPVSVLPPKPECPWHLNFALSRKGCKDCPKDHICCVYNGEEVCVPTVFTKPGVCPRRLPRVAFGPCVESCSYDSDCPNYEKCCSNRCGHQCMAPVSVLPPKPECPWHLNFALSRKGCKDCPRDHICCVYNGEEVCVPTVFTKPGVCPRKFLLPSSSAFVPCVESCSYDSDCPDNEKCCSNGCAHECMAPYIVKPGLCPRRRLDERRCAETCSTDNDCPNQEKCCFSGCGRQCMEPYPVWLAATV
ncbi:unnamed protein product [Oreochromis niloticus]|nr:unnamed protein product [Mustela putorius furo]